MEFNHAIIFTPAISLYYGGGVMNQRNVLIVDTLARKLTICGLNPSPRKKSYKYLKYYYFFKGYISEFSKNDQKSIFNIINNNPDVDVLFINNSRYGLLAKQIKKKYPKLKIVFFYHNAEYKYACEEYKLKKTSVKLLLNIFYILHAEYLSLKYSDERIVLTRRDGEALKKIAPKNKKKNIVLPMSIEDKGQVNYQLSATGQLELLFVGSNFFANVNGIDWFVRNVMPQISAKLTIIGKDMEQYTNNWSSDKVTVLGTVESLKEYYEKAHIVVSPLFSGSGMKTKTIESLMYGIPVLGTDEAFIGIDNIDINKIGARCNTPDEFIKSIEYFDKNRDTLLTVAHSARKVFCDYYSIESSVKILQKDLF